MNFSDNPVLIPRNTFLGEVRPATQEDITELGDASAAELEQRLLKATAIHHPNAEFSAAAQAALDAIEHEKAAGTYATANVSAATASAERTRTTQEPCTPEELREMLPTSGDLHDMKAPDGRPYAEHLMDVFTDFSSVFAKDPKNPTVTNLMECKIGEFL